MQTDAQNDPFARFPHPGGSRQPIFWWWVLLGVIFLVGLGVRLYDLGDPPVDFHPTRQLHSALIARGMYYQNNPNVPSWQREMAVTQWQSEGEIEPQVFERVTAWAYGLVGQADLRIPRLVALALWMVGGVFVTWAALDIAGWGGALAGAWYFLIWPYGVVASRAFQPEPLLVSFMVMALWAALRWDQRRTWRWALAAGLLSGIAIYLKVVAVFLIGLALVTLVLLGGGWRRLREPQVWLAAALAVLPYGMYHIYGVYIHGNLVSQFSLRFFPQMWVDPAFYLRWISNLGRVLPFEMVVAAALGTCLVQQSRQRAVLLAMWVGYFLYGMALPHHISTHDYYHLLLFPSLTLGLAGLAGAIVRSLPGPRGMARVFVSIALLAVLVNSGYSARTQLKRFDAAHQAQVWAEIGALLGPGASATALVDDYGCGLKYWGWVNPSIWLTEDEILWRQSLGQENDFSARFEMLVAGKDFFVVTQFDELERQPELKSLLYAQYAILRQTPDYLVFDLRSPKR